MENIWLECGGMKAVAEWDPAVQEWSGSVAAPAGVHLSFHGRTREELEQSFRDMQEARLEFCAELAEQDAPASSAPVFLRDPVFGLVEPEESWRRELGERFAEVRPRLAEVVSLDGDRWVPEQDACFAMKCADEALWKAVTALPSVVRANAQRVLYVFAAAWKLAYGKDFSGFGEVPA